MRGQLIPFIVNGQYWRHVEVDERLMACGEVSVPVHPRMDARYFRQENEILTAYHVRFRMATLGQVEPPFRARWPECFWAVDERVYIARDSGEIFFAE